METRKKVAIFIDYVLRVPNFKASYDAFKAELFSDKDFGVDTEDAISNPVDTRMYWQKQLANPEVEAFYVAKKAPENDYDMRSQQMRDYFFNDEQYKKFVDDYSFNLYTDCQVPNMQDIDIVNICQARLFEVILIDDYQSKRKISNTFFFLSKNRVYPQAVVLLNEGNKINEEGYVGIWNPRVYPEQVNAKGSKAFLEWLQALEANKK